MAPRQPKCIVCLNVAVPEDVTIRLYDPDLNHVPLVGAVEYLRDVGLTGTVRQLEARALAHRRHVQRWLDGGGAIAPAKIEAGVSRIPAAPVNATWLDTNQQGMNIGLRALGEINELIGAGMLGPKELVSVARLGQTAATKRADLEMKGQLRRQENMARLAAGFRKPAEVA